MLRIGIVEDNRACAEELNEYIGRYCSEHGLEQAVTLFPDGLEVTDGYTPVWDIIFMDIEMPCMDGMEASRRIREKDPSVILIFITTMAKYAIKGYEVNALDFVLKPVNYNQLAARLDKALRLLERNSERYLILPDEDGKKKLAVSDILYIEVRGHKLDVVTRRRVYSLRRTLGEMEQALEDCHFSKCNQCYLVNLKNVDKVKKDSVVVGGHELEISRSRKKPFIGELSEYLGAEI